MAQFTQILFSALLLAAPLSLSASESAVHLRASSELRADGVFVFDQGNTSEADSGQVDTDQDVCEEVDDEDILEEFFDTSVGVDLVNNGNTDIRIRNIRFVIRRIGGKRRFRSRRISPFGSPIIPATGAATRVHGLVFRADSGSKFLANSSTKMESDTGFRTLKIIVTGRDELGRRHRTKIRTTISIRNVDRCT